MAAQSRPVEKVMNLTDTKQQFSKVVNEVAKGESYVVVEKNGLESAVIIEPEEFRRYQRYAREQRDKRVRFFERLVELGEAFEDISDNQLEEEILKAQAEVKDEMAKARHS